jgi:hypothetical protein
LNVKNCPIFFRSILGTTHPAEDVNFEMKVLARLSPRPSGFEKFLFWISFWEIQEIMKKNLAFLYAGEGSSLRAFWIFNPSTRPTSLVVGVSNLESSKARPFL